MFSLEVYQEMMSKIEEPFLGLPHSIFLMVNRLINNAELSSGIVSNMSYADIAKLLTVKSAPGRKDTGAPSKQTIRNWIKSIERECGAYFQVITDGQRLQFIFPEMPKIFKNIAQNAEVNTGLNTHESLENIEQNEDFIQEFNMDVNTEVNTPKAAVKNIFIYKNKNNNNTEKKSISHDFTPSVQTIERARALGFSNVCEPNEILNFIAYNQATGSRWADFNPIYLRWLAQSRDRQNQKTVTEKAFNKETRRVNDVSSSRTYNTKSHKRSIRERVIDAWSEEFSFCEITHRFKPKICESTLDWNAVASNG